MTGPRATTVNIELSIAHTGFIAHRLYLVLKATTLIFISGRGSAIPSAKRRKSGYIYNLVKNL